MNNPDAIATYQRWIRYSTATIADMVELSESLGRRGCEGSATMLKLRIAAAIGQQKIWEHALAREQRVAS